MSCRAPAFQGFTGRVFMRKLKTQVGVENTSGFTLQNSCLSMSWNIQRPNGVHEMAPSEGQPCISHAQLLSNRDALERKLSQRGPRQELVNRGIMPAVSAAPAILSQRTKLERAKTGDLLQKKIRARPNRAQLVQRHILKETPGAVDPSLIDKQMRLKRKKLEDNLNDKLSFRPGPLELVQENILEAGTPISQAVQEGTVPYTETTDYLDSFSPESVDSPDASPSPEPSHVSSPPSIALSPGSTCITSTVQALASLQAQTQKHTQQQQQKQQQQHQLFLQQQNGHNLTAPSQQLSLQASSVPKKEAGKSRKKAAKPKVKKYKYHEYRPPNGEVQKCDLPSDSPYGLLLQQQQLYLQLQVLYQNYPHHCMLPSIPENVKLGANGTKNGNGADAEKTVKIEDMRVVDMRRALKERGLPVFGSKTDLIKRLKEAGPLPTEGVSSSSAASVVVSTQEQITTSAPIMSQVISKTIGHSPIHRSNSLPVQNANLEAVEQLKMQILANNQSLQQLSVPPEVQQQLQQLQYLNLQLQLQHLNIQQQQSIQPKPQNIPVNSQNVAVKRESLTDSNCSFSPPPDQKQIKDQKPSFILQQQSQCMQMSPGNHSPQQQLHQPQQIDHVDQALAHLQEQAQSLDLSPHNVDSNPSSVESHLLSWDQQHPLFDGESDSYPSPGSQHSDLSSLSPLQMDHPLSHSMDALPNSNLFQASVRPEGHHMQRSYSERSPPDCPDDFFLMVPQTKPRSMSEPQFPVSTHKRSSSFPSIPFATPPPSYEAHMAAQKQHRNFPLGGQMGGGFAMPNASPKQEDMDLPLESVIQDKELSQELHKAMMKNLSSFDHDEILEILGEPRNQLPTSVSSFAGVMSVSQSSPANSHTMSRSPSLGYLRTLPAHSSAVRISRSCEDVSQLPVGNKFSLPVDNNTLSDFDHMLMSPLSPMKVDSCDTDDSSSLMDHTSNSIPISTSNSGVGRTDNLGWLDLSLSPSAQNITPQGSVELSHNNNNSKGTPPAFLYDPTTTFKGDESFPYLSLFDLETPTALQPPADFAETMDYCI